MPVLCAQGRFHHYEGHSFEDVGIIIKIFSFLTKYFNLLILVDLKIRLETLGNFMIVEKFLDFSFINENIPYLF